MAFETHTIMPSFRLHIKPTKQFKTTAVRVFLSRNLDEDTTRAALLPYILRRGTRSHPTMIHISRHLEDLYGTAIGTDVTKVGEWQVLTFAADVPNERYLPTRIPVLRRALEFLNELIFEPAGGKGFVQKYVQTEKENMRRFIAALFENRASYAMEQLMEHMCTDEPFARYEYGHIKELTRVGAAGLFRFYRGLCRRAPVDMYVVGDIEPQALCDCVAEVFKRRRSDGSSLRKLVVKGARRKPREITEHADVAQGRVLMGYRSRVRFHDRASHALAMAAAVLGAFPHSKLFRVVREKASLAYSVNAQMIRSKGIMVAYAGVEPGREAEARKLIEEQVAQVQAGEISDFELDSTKSSILDDLASITDSPSKEVDFNFVHLLHGERTTPREIARAVRELTREEIASAAARLKLDTVFVLTKEFKVEGLKKEGK